jgi:ABC-2 type transport system permease protein
MTTTIELPTFPTTLTGRLWWLLRDGWTITRRELGHIRRDPGQLIAAVVFPAIMVLLFGYVFGSAITVPGGGGYREYLMPGLFAMSAIAGVMASALLISKDVAEGVMDRFRSMPIARSAVPFGRTAADLLGAAVGVAIMALIALLVGWRAHNGLAATLMAFGLVLLLRYAVSWIGVWVGLSISALVAACRELFGNPTVLAAHASLPLRHPVATTIGWALLILVIFVPLSTRRHQAAGR